MMEMMVENCKNTLTGGREKVQKFLKIKMSTQDSGNSQPSFPSLCKNGCGFFGGIENRGYCSVCFKEILKKEEAEKSGNNEKSEAAEALAQLTLEEKSDSLHEEETKAEAVVNKIEDELPQ